MENGAFAPMENGKCSIFHSIFKYMIFQRRQKALVWVEGLSHINLPTFISMTGPIPILALLGGIYHVFHMSIKKYVSKQ